MPSVDINAREDRDGNRPITEQQRVDIQNATNEAYRMISGFWTEMSGIWEQSGRPSKRRKKRKTAWKNNNKIVTWFGSGALTNYQIRRTKNRVKRIKREFNSAVRFTIIQCQSGSKSFLCKNGRAAYCSPATPIKLCPSFFGMGLADQAATIIHELCHKNAMIHRRRAKDRAAALALAISHPRLARKNPENYEQICHEY